MKIEPSHGEPARSGDGTVDSLDQHVDELYRARLEHVRGHLARADVDALLICDPNDLQNRRALCR